MIKTVKVFSVMEGNGPNAKEFFRGTIGEVCTKLNCSHGAIYEHSDRDRSLFQKYYIKSVGTTKIETGANGRPNGCKNKKQKKTEDEKKDIPKPKRISKRQQNYERIIHCLDIYGNTGVSKNPKIYKKDFERDGYVVDIEYRPKRVIKSKGYGDTEIWDEIWIITLIEKRKVNEC